MAYLSAMTGSARARWSPLANRRRGLTLIDLVLTITIIGVLAAVAMPRFSSAIEFHRANGTAQRIKSDLEMAARYARANNTTETVTFNTEDHSYSFSSFKSMNRPSEVYSVWLNESPHDSQITSFLHSEEGTSISFNGFGIPDCSVEITITSGGESKTITVEDVTGRVEIAD